MNSNRCQTNEVNKFISSTEKGPFTGRDNTLSFNKIGSRLNSPPILKDKIELKFLQHSEDLNQSRSYVNIRPRTLEDQSYKFEAPNLNDNETSWAKDFRYNFPKNVEPPIENQIANLNINNGLRTSQTDFPLGFYSQKNFNIASFPVVDHRIFKTTGLELPINSHIDSLINAEFSELEASSLEEDVHTEEENSGTSLEDEETAMKGLASDIIEFCDNNSANKDVKERLNSSKFMGLMGSISDGSIVLKKDNGTERNLQKHVGFCFQNSGNWAGLEFHDVEDRIA